MDYKVKDFILIGLLLLLVAWCSVTIFVKTRGDDVCQTEGYKVTKYSLEGVDDEDVFERFEKVCLDEVL